MSVWMQNLLIDTYFIQFISISATFIQHILGIGDPEHENVVCRSIYIFGFKIMYLYYVLVLPYSRTFAYKLKDVPSALPLGYELCTAAHGRLVHYHLRLQSGCLLCLSPPEGGNTFVTLFWNHLHTLDVREAASVEMRIGHSQLRLRREEKRTSVIDHPQGRVGWTSVSFSN